MADPNARYPLATADGQSIPNETIRPVGLYIIALSTTPTSLLTLAAGYKTITVVSTVDAVLRFGAAASIPADSTLLTNALFLPKNVIMTVSPATMSISAVALSGTGSLRVSMIESWAGLGLEYQYGRR